ncbi:hypothetical protein KAR91_64965 [Candidatus Pacearchaeota archaeon]|nr:hypothetical protein [Candidatus Pacearchaeota archaeon]
MKKRRLPRFFSLLIAVAILLTVFSVDTLADTTNKDTEQDGTNVYSGDEGDISDNTVKKQTLSQFGSSWERMNKSFTERGIRRREIIPLHIVTNHSGFEKITKMKLIRPTSIDVDNDGDLDIRIWWFNRPAIDLHPPALALKTTFIIRRLPGMEESKYDELEVYLEYYPRITQLFYITKDIDRIRLGYQSPKGEEIPKTCVISDKMIPHLFYPKRKITHRISVDPGSIAGKHNLNLVVAFANFENNDIIAEQIMQINYSPAVKITDITFERNKQKLFGKGQTLKITRTKNEPTNVTLHLSELYGCIFLTGFRIVERGSITVENIPEKINLSWVIGRKGYLEIDTYNDKAGRVTARVNNVLILGFIPETTFKGRVSWENRTLIGAIVHDVFNLGFEVYNSLKMRDLSVEYQTQFNTTRLFEFNVEVGASELSLDLDPEVEFGNAFVQYWLLPIFDKDNTTIELNNLNMTAENFYVHSVINDKPHDNYTFPSDPSKLSNDKIVRQSSNRRKRHIKHLNFSGSDVYIFLSGFLMMNITNSFEGQIDLQMIDGNYIQNQTTFYYSSTGNTVNYQETETAFSSINFSTSSSISTFDVLINGKDITNIIGVTFNLAGILEADGFYRRNNQDSIITIENIGITGNLYGSIRSRTNNTASSTSTNIKGLGEVKIDKIHHQNKYDNVLTIGSIYLLSNRSFTSWESIDNNILASSFFSEGNGTLHISDIFQGDKYNNNLSVEMIHISGSISADIRYSGETYPYSTDRYHRNGSLLITNIKSTSAFNQSLQINRIYTEGDFALTILPSQNNPYYWGLRFEGDAYLNISGVTSSTPELNALDYLVIDASGDLQIEKWTDYDSFDKHLFMTSTDGLTSHQFSIQIESNTITRSFTSTPFKISSGYLYIVSHILGMDNDGMIFIDSSPLHIENGNFTFWSEKFDGWGIRFALPEYFDANGWCLQWDRFYFQYLGIYIPINWHLSGSKTGRIAIALSDDGIHWYRFWPIWDPDSQNEMENNQESNHENMNQYNNMKNEGGNVYE